MDLFATGSSLQPGLPARTGDTATDGDRTEKLAVFGVFLDLAMSFPSPDAVIASGPEGKTASPDETQDLEAANGNPAMPGGNILPGILPLDLPGTSPADLTSVIPVDLPIRVPGGEVPSSIEPGGDQPVRTPIVIPSLDLAVVAEPDGSEPDVPPPALQPTPIQGSLPPLLRSKLASLPQFKTIEAVLPEAKAIIAAAPVLQIGRTLANTQQVPLGTVQAATLSASAGTVAAPVTAQLAERDRDAQMPSRIIAPTESEPVASSDPMARIVRPATKTLSVPAVATPGSGMSAPLATGVEAASDKPAELPSLASGSQEDDAAVPSQRIASPALTAQADVAISPSQPDGPLTPVADSRVSQATQPQTATTARVSEATRQEFGDIVERLARAREAEQPDLVRTIVSTRDFGPVAMQMRTVESRLHVAMTSADPGFAPAVQAASASAATGQQTSPDTSSQQQAQSQQSQQSSQSSGSGQSAPDGQSRQQQSERAAQQAQGRSASANASATKEPRGDENGTIYA